MTFTTKRGRPSTKPGLTLIEGGKTKPAQSHRKKPARIIREAIDICYEKSLISAEEHWAAIHFRWLYTLKFGAPGVSATDPERLNGHNIVSRNEPEWQENREREYAMAIEKLRQGGALKIVLNIAVFGCMPRFLGGIKTLRKGQIIYNSSEVIKLREGLEILARHWGKIPAPRL